MQNQPGGGAVLGGNGGRGGGAGNPVGRCAVRGGGSAGGFSVESAMVPQRMMPCRVNTSAYIQVCFFFTCCIFFTSICVSFTSWAKYSVWFFFTTGFTDDGKVRAVCSEPVYTVDFTNFPAL